MTAKVYDIIGKLIRDVSEDLVVVETSITADIGLESPASGIYFLRIEKGKKFLTKKIIIRSFFPRGPPILLKPSESLHIT